MQPYETNSDATDMAPATITDKAPTDKTEDDCSVVPDEITETQLLKLKVELLEAQLAAIKALKDAAPIVTEAAKNPEVIKETGPIDKWVTGGGTKSHIKNPA
jgi:hypothetical protein